MYNLNVNGVVFYAVSSNAGYALQDAMLPDVDGAANSALFGVVNRVNFSLLREVVEEVRYSHLRSAGLEENLQDFLNEVEPLAKDLEPEGERKGGTFRSQCCAQ